MRRSRAYNVEVSLGGFAPLDCPAAVSEGALLVTPRLPGDANGDGVVGPVDLALLLSNWRRMIFN